MNQRPTITIESESEAATIRLGQKLAGLARDRDVITLDGYLGTGKTVFARAFISALGGGPEVPRPTFTLLQTYQSEKGDLHHFDLYRLDGPDDVLELGLEDCLDSGITLIEWPDRLGDRLPRNRLQIHFEMAANEDGRHIYLTGQGPWPERLEQLHG